MDGDRRSDSNPFSDNAAIQDEREAIVESTLSVGRNATLTLGTDAVIVLDDGLRRDSGFDCFGLLRQKTTNTRSIPYFNVLWTEIVKDELTIRYAKPTSKSANSSVNVAYINYTIENSTLAQEKACRWVERLLDRAYGRAQRNKRVKLLINPFGGAGKAPKIYAKSIEPIFAAARCEVDVERTTHSGHALEICENLDINAFDVVASASGDGLPHECINGLGRKPNAAEALRKVAVVQLPCGTGNAMSWNLTGTGEPSTAALCIVKGLRTPMDLVSVTQGNTRTLSFLSQSLGIVAESDLGTENIRWMGDVRFIFGFLVRLLGKTVYPMDIAVKTEIEDKEDIRRHYAEHMANRKRQGGALSHADLDGPLDTSTGLGLPPLHYGTINDPLPEDAGWTPMMSYPNIGNFYSGNMAMMAADAPFFPASLPCDGLLDLITIDGDISRMKAVDLLLSVPKGTFFDKECVRYRKVSAIRVVPKFGSMAKRSENEARQNKLGQMLDRIGAAGNGRNASRDGGYFSVDGEKMPFQPFQVEVHKGLGTVLSRNVGMYESIGPQGWEDVDISGTMAKAKAKAKAAGEVL
ncbi:sphinganine kinase lcb4 [Exophiala xenobiotica]|uniref:Sphinganine kinase lcb4 n=1 Tax=Vermiconidia calcicola TaxID=1690605 RepID=A0AAV9QC82_9PEZI|nr:sphinganine kinase lcb4 [Exophiala xenobiotica]KAK5538440.1 sphinganine kinase lcb4 [Vermiconidia calcicola]KAK5194268.1 sphinganine kinase lcb4 [Exophiala xenobiotica]KAK5213024.1 sphinganine kinase lcb4 [Exophiala xenobiotica]KAK5264198.1 sphinganine kinase lcb4 [Exophiala xenobiotica]